MTFSNLQKIAGIQENQIITINAKGFISNPHNPSHLSNIVNNICSIFTGTNKESYLKLIPIFQEVFLKNIQNTLKISPYDTLLVNAKKGIFRLYQTLHNSFNIKEADQVNRVHQYVSQNLEILKNRKKHYICGSKASYLRKLEFPAPFSSLPPGGSPCEGFEYVAEKCALFSSLYSHKLNDKAKKAFNHLEKELSECKNFRYLLDTLSESQVNDYLSKRLKEFKTLEEPQQKIGIAFPSGFRFQANESKVTGHSTLLCLIRELNGGLYLIQVNPGPGNLTIRKEIDCGAIIPYGRGSIAFGPYKIAEIHKNILKIVLLKKFQFENEKKAATAFSSLFNQKNYQPSLSSPEMELTSLPNCVVNTPLEWVRFSLYRSELKKTIPLFSSFNKITQEWINQQRDLKKGVTEIPSVIPKTLSTLTSIVHDSVKTISLYC